MSPATPPTIQDRKLTTDDFEALLEFRDGIRRFLRWSEEAATAAGVTPAQHQLLLAIRGHKGPASVRDIADHLLLKHHSAVELVDRAVNAGLVERIRGDGDQRVVQVRLTRSGDRTLRKLSAAHLEELARMSPHFSALWHRLPE